MSITKKNYIYNILYQLLLIILPLITTPYISRVLGAKQLGIYSYTYSIVQYFVLFAMLGVNNYGNRCIAKVRDNKKKTSTTFFEIYLLQIVLGILMLLFFIIYNLFFVHDNKLIYFLQSIYLLSTLFDINWFFFGIENFKLTVIRNTFIKIVTIILIFVFVKSSNDLWVYTFIISMGSLVSQIILISYLPRYIGKVKVNTKSILKHLKPNLVLFIPVIATSIYTIMDKIMIGKISNMSQVAYYEYAEKLKNIALGFITALGVVMLPKISNMIANNKKSAAQTLTNYSLKFAMFLAIAMSFGLAGISDVFVPIFYGTEFSESIKIICVLSFTLIFIAWANVIRTQILIPNNIDKPYIISTIIGAIFNIVLNIIFIKKFNAFGASIATLISEFIVALYQTIYAKKEIKSNGIAKLLILYNFAGIIMFFSIKLIGTMFGISIKTIILEIFIGGLMYVLIVLIGLLIIKDDFLTVLLKKVKRN